MKNTPLIMESGTASERAYAEAVLGYPKGDIVSITTTPHDGGLWIKLMNGDEWKIDRLGGRHFVCGCVICEEKK